MIASENNCSFGQCVNSQLSRGYCSGHYQQFMSGRPLTPLQHRNKGVTCSFDTCLRESHAGGLCGAHSRQARSGGRLKPLRRYSGAGWHLNSKGYRIRKVRILGKLETIYEHREVVESHLGRKLLPIENIHHKNGQRDQNNIENLELWSKSQPPGQRVADKIRWAKEILATYGNDPTIYEGKSHK